MHRSVEIALIAVLVAPLLAQQPSPEPPAGQLPHAEPVASTSPVAGSMRFLAADVHVSPRSLRTPVYHGPFLHGDRYVLRQATMSDLIATAYDLKAGGGPSWLDWDRYEIEAKIPRGATPEVARFMLQNLLAERFKLVVHSSDVPAPAYVLTVANSKPILKPSVSTAEGRCRSKPASSQEPDAAPLVAIECRGVSMDSLGKTLFSIGDQYLVRNVPVIDATGLKGAYDFDLEWTPHNLQGTGGSPGISLFAALRQQLGLTLQAKDFLQPGVVVDSVNEVPTPNLPDLAKVMPPLAVQFEVAVIRRSDPSKPLSGYGVSDQVNLSNNSLRWLIDYAWDLNPSQDENMVGAPEWLATDHYDVHAKLAQASDLGMAAGGSATRDWDNLRPMLRALLIDRFQMKVQTKDRPVDAFALVADHPRLTRADPSERTGCKFNPGPDGVDPRLNNPVLPGKFTCANITMAEFAEWVQDTANGFFLGSSIKDETGLKGGWDLTIAWSGAAFFQHDARGTQNGASEAATSVPSGAVSIYDALGRLGLKAVKVKRPEPVLVIDQISRQPTEN